MSRSKTAPAERRTVNTINPSTGDVAIASTECAPDLIVIANSDETPPAHALVAQANAQLHANAAQREIDSLRRQLTALQTSYALQLANSEQARRVASCLRLFQQQLLHTITQPLLVLDRDGCVQDWNAALERLLSPSQEPATGQPLTAWLTGPVCDALLHTNHEAFAAEDDNAPCEQMYLVNGPFSLRPGLTAERFLVLPLSRIPGWVEATVALIELEARPTAITLPLAA